MRTKSVLKYAVALVVLVAAYGVTRWWIDRGVGTVLVNVLALPTQNARTLALGATRASLSRVVEPNLYAFVNQSDLQAAVNSALKTRREQATGDETVLLESATVLVRPEGIGITLPFDAKRALSFAAFAGSVEMDVAPSASGAYLELHPITARVRLDHLRLGPWSFEGKEWATRAAASVLNGVVTFAAGRIAGLSVPLNLGAFGSFDPANVIPGAVVEGGRPLNVRVGADEVAVATGDGGLHVLGSIVTISDAEFESIASALEALKARAAESPSTDRECPVCGFGKGVGDYFTCARSRAVCEARRKLGTPDTDLQLTASQALVLSDLKKNPKRADLYEFFEPMLVPYGTIEEAPPEDLSDIQYATQVRAVLQVLLARRDEVENPAAIPGDGATRFAVHRKFVSQALVAALDPLRSTPLSATLDNHNENFHAPVKIDPAPDLHCRGNARGCESNFEFEPEPNRGCDSNCKTTNRHCVFGVCVDVPGIDLGCQGRKIDCERLKGQEKAGWAIRRGVALADWKLRKDACELLKATEIAGCDINQAWLNAWGGQTVGNLAGEARISGARAQFRLDDVAVAEDLTSIEVVATLSGGAHVNATVVYKPADTVQGRLVCVANWGGELNADVGLKPQSVTFKATLETDPTGGVLLRSESQEFIVTTVPPPGIALLKDIPQMAVACPAVATAAGDPTVGLVAAITLAFNDSFKVPVGGQERRFHDFSLDEIERTLTVELAPKSVVGTIR